VTVFLRADNGAVELRVEDSGPGIEEDQIHQAMQPFTAWTTSGTRVRDRAGAGG
jgi:two-component system sensor histidine kinase TctE